jgi:hypothetical protein
LCKAASHLPPLLSDSSLLRCSGATRRLAAAAIRPAGSAALSNEESSRQTRSYTTGRRSKRSWPRLVWWLLDVCILNAFHLWSIDQPPVRHLDFREQLMYELVAQLPVDQRPQRASKRPNPADSLAKDHYLQHSDAERECAMCSHRRAGQRTETRFICQACGVHLCIGQCFSSYHASM